MKRKKFYVILHNIRSVYNVGSIFRTADALGVDKIILSGYTPDPENNPKISKTALGAERSVEWEKHCNTTTAIKKIRKKGFRIVALEQTKKSHNVIRYKPGFPLALLLGNEVSGLSKTMLSKVDEIIEIPMLGAKESLNVSVAFGIAGFVLIYCDDL
jgi:tRNA G18 (ribose-2'-O)-methylase SpoU